MDKPPTVYDDLANLMRNVPNYQQKIPDVDAYIASIDIPETVEGPVGGCEQPEPRYVQRNSPQGQAIVAAQLKREREAELRAMETEPVLSIAATTSRAHFTKRATKRTTARSSPRPSRRSTGRIRSGGISR